MLQSDIESCYFGEYARSASTRSYFGPGQSTSSIRSSSGRRGGLRLTAARYLSIHCGSESGI